MANLSQEQYKRMHDFLERMRLLHTDSESAAAIDRLETELCSAKFGLIWEQHSEEADEALKNYTPVLTPVKELEIISDASLPVNYLIEGDNLYSLSLLRESFAGKIGCIYIDPPYNTGNRDFLFNDDIAGKEDGFRHSKWLSFMQRRLELAALLLSPKGVIFISIDDNEQANLRLLCDRIFGEHNFLGMLPRITKKSGKDHSAGIARNHDYILIYAKNKSMVHLLGIKADQNSYPLRDEYYQSRGGYKLNQTLDYDSLWYNPKMDFPITASGETFYPGGDKTAHDLRQSGKHKAKDWVWRWSREKFEFGLANGFVVIKTGKGRPRIYTKTYANASISATRPYSIQYKERQTPLSSVALTDNRYSNDNAKKEITSLGLESFGFPKPSALIARLIGMVEDPGIVLDFFAGSGTTAQAVLELNEADGGNRSFILCTNNENNICRDITYQRIKTVITGKRTDGTDYSRGIAANLAYLLVELKKK